MIVLTKKGQASLIPLKLFLNDNMSIRGGHSWVALRNLFAGVSCNTLIFYENVSNADVKWKLSYGNFHSHSGRFIWGSKVGSIDLSLKTIRI